MNSRIKQVIAQIILLLLVIAPGYGEESTETFADAQQESRKIWVDEKTGAYLPLDLEFKDENGETITLASLVDRPTILLPIYFYCPNSCSTNLANLAAAMNRMKLSAGKDYRAIALSFNDQDSPEDASDAKRNYVNLLHDEFPLGEWAFLTGSKKNIEAVLDTIGYAFKPLDDGTFIHPSALVTVAADGMVIKYVYGTFIPGDVEIALAEAKKGEPAISVKRLLNYCFNYDPDKNKSLFTMIKISVLLVFCSLVVLFFVFFIRKRGSGETGGETPLRG